MSDAAEVTFDAPVKKAGKKPKKRTAAPAREARSAAPFPGLTRTACADTCNEKACAVSGKPYCAHPCKGGLQSADQNDPKALKRLQHARAQLDVRVDPDRFK